MIRFNDGTSVNYRPGVTDRNGIIFPPDCRGSDLGDHLGGSQSWTGWNLDSLFVAGGQHLHMRATDINNQDFHGILRWVVCLAPTFCSLNLSSYPRVELSSNGSCIR